MQVLTCSKMQMNSQYLNSFVYEGAQKENFRSRNDDWEIFNQENFAFTQNSI